MEQKDRDKIFINYKTQEQFQIHYGLLVDELERLRSMFDEVTEIISGKQINKEEQVIYFLVNTIWDDFQEILILYSNGFPLGAMKILRGMFERAVHVAHFLDNFQDIELFWDYAWIDGRKMTRFIPSGFDGEVINEINQNAKEVESKFEIPVCDKCKKEDCKECKKKRISHAWFGKRDIVSIAEKVGFSKEFIYFTYYLPLQENHPKLQSIFRRQNKNEDNSVEYSQDSDATEERSVLWSGHFLLIIAFEAYVKFFKIPENEIKLKKLTDNWDNIWKEITHKLKTN
jgi:hypothetical protein